MERGVYAASAPLIPGDLSEGAERGGGSDAKRPKGRAPQSVLVRAVNTYVVRAGQARRLPYVGLHRSGLSRNYAVGMNGDRSRLGCRSARPRAEHRCERTHQIVNRFTCVEWPARARPTAPEAGALPSAIALFRLREGETPLTPANPQFSPAAPGRERRT
jgi:hypothetical protein